MKTAATEPSFLKWLALLLVLLMAVAGGFFIQRNAREKAQWEEREAALQTLRQSQVVLEAEIKEMSKNLECEEDFHCRILGYGLRTCEAYSEFLIYSVLHVDHQMLMSKISEFNRNAQELNNLNFKVPSCGVVTPSVACIEKLCRVRE